MAAFDHVPDLNHVALKPRLLRSLLKKQVPDETRPFRNASVLSYILSKLKTHELLSESVSESSDPKNVSSWRSGMDAWVDRILMLARNDLPDKCWVGVCLLGVTITECSSERFVASYNNWFNALVPHIQQSGVSQLVKVASCAAVSDLLTRLGAFSNLKKDGNSHAGKLVQPILKLLNEGATEAVLEVATSLLFSIMSNFPSSVIRHYDNVEGAIVSKIMSGSYRAESLKKLASCLALLPKAKGDEDNWLLMMQKILLSLSNLLNGALEGLEEESGREEAVALLVPPGKDPPPPLGGQMMSGDLLNMGERSHQLLISTISSLMNCCYTMLISSYPVQVAVPVRPVLAVVQRVLMVNGSLPQSLQPFTTAMQQEFVCSELPALQLCSLELLEAVVRGMRSQLLPHAADLVRILMGYFKKCWLAELRAKVYSIVRELLFLFGSGIAIYISEEVISNGFIDLKISGHGSDGAIVNGELPMEATFHRQQKKRKHGTGVGLPVEQLASFGPELKASKESRTSIALKIAALKALEALISVGGALRSDSWRTKVDHLLLEVATNALRMGLTHDLKPFLLKDHNSTLEDFQLAALHALRDSLLSPSGVRPPYLAQGLELFNKGKRSGGTKVREFCGRALSSLERPVHPRALPFIDMFRTGTKGDAHDVYDFLNDIYLESNNTGSEVQSGNKKMHFDEKSADIPMDKNLVQDTTAINPSTSDEGRILENRDVDVEANRDSVMQDKTPDLITTSLTAKKAVEKGSSTPEEPELLRESEAGKNALDSKGLLSTSGVGSEIEARKDDNVFKLSGGEQDGELSEEFPDIVDADPDSNSDSEY